MNKIRIALLAATMAVIATAAAAQTPVKTGIVVRGVNGDLPRTCDFSREEVDQSGRMTGASVQCKKDGTLREVLAHLPATFNAYCQVRAADLGGARLITAPLADNPEHCDLSAITPKDAQRRFGGAVQR
ncbi:protein rhiC [Rhodopseudomonas palustris]|uniref:protein rhiC n=1 Tax=Rhodopseudomonas TaxID=1073 RepID=UPI0021F2D9A9|nr:protein rhiC [Rhodopseudomonas palustris]UYO45983.1 protein rhiC [Rhodopseudomonas palustris]